MPKETALYDVLEVAPDATPADLKRAYRRLALLNHPDKVGDAGVEKFQQIQDAWNVLGTEKLRSIYDRNGQMGIDMYNQLGDAAGILLDPEAENMLYAILCLASIVVAVLSLFPIFIALVADGVVSWSFGVVFIPIWMVDIALLWFIIMRYFRSKIDPETHVFEDETDEDLTPEQREQTRQKRIEQAQLFDRLRGIKFLVLFMLFFLFQIFLVMKLDTSISWTWGSVFIPWFVVEGIHLLSNVVLAITVLTSPVTSKVVILFGIFRPWIARVLFAVLIVLRADEIIQVNWGVVFIPVYFQIIDWIVTPIMRYRTVAPSLPEEPRQAMKAFLIMRMVATIVLGVLFFISLGLFIARLNSEPGTSYSVAVIMIPLFILLGMSFCCCCCCIPCLLGVGGAAMDSSMEEGQTRQVSPYNRIEYLVNNNTTQQNHSTVNLVPRSPRNSSSS